MSIALSSLRTKAKQRADKESSEFVSTSEWTSYINSAYKELYDILVNANEDYYTTSTNLTITSGSSVALPATFYKLRGVDASGDGGSTFYTIKPFDFLQRNNKNISRISPIYSELEKSYRIIGSNLHIVPTDNATGTYRIWYVPKTTELSSEGDTAEGVNGWEEYIIVTAAMMALSKEESDITALLLEQQKLKQRIDLMSSNRDIGYPAKIQNTRKMKFYEF